MVAKALALVFVLAVAGCTTPGPVEDPRQVWCEHNEARRDATPDTDRAELDRINAHNAKGKLWCQWAP